MKGSRVQNVVQELRGEKIDIIPWHVDDARFVCNALAPADIARVIIDEGGRAMEVIVPDDSLSVAIGKRGQNVRLASKLTGWHLDVRSEADYDQALKDGYESLISLSGMSTELADGLHQKGLYSADELASCSVEELTQVRELSEDEALALIESAQAWVLEKEKADEENAAAEDESQEATSAEDTAAVEEEPPTGDDLETGDDEDETSESSV